MAVTAFVQTSEPCGSTPSLLGNNLTSSATLTAYASKNKIRLVETAQSRAFDGPSTSNITSIRYIPLFTGEWVLCVGSTLGTQIYSENGAYLMHLLSVEKNESDNADRLACHRGACTLQPDFQNNRQLLCFGDHQGKVHIVDYRPGIGFSTASSTIEAFGTGITCLEAVNNELIVGHEDGSVIWWNVYSAGEEPVYEQTHSDQNDGEVPVGIAAIGISLSIAFGSGRIVVYTGRTRFAEIAAHARWITGISAFAPMGLIATVSEDTVLNVWKISDDCGIDLIHSGVVANKLLTGVSFIGNMVGDGTSELGVVAYDSDHLFRLKHA